MKKKISKIILTFEECLYNHFHAMTPNAIVTNILNENVMCTIFPFCIMHCEPLCSDSDIGPHFFLKKRHGDDDDGRETSPYMLGHHQKKS